MDDMLPRMTPKKKTDGNSEVPSPHVSRDDSVHRGSLARTSFANIDHDDLLPADLEMDNIDLPPMLPPADEEVGGAAAAGGAGAQGAAGDNQEGVADMDEDPPPATPEDFPDVPPQEPPPEDFPVDELPPMNPGPPLLC